MSKDKKLLVKCLKVEKILVRKVRMSKCEKSQFRKDIGTKCQKVEMSFDPKIQLVKIT